MNLIEQLGGYECAKAEYSDPMYEDGELYTIKATGTRFFKHNLAEELLEYRRQHNIFEVGDYVCFKTLGDGYVHKYTKYHEFKYDLKHATDAEIEAGHRL